MQEDIEPEVEDVDLDDTDLDPTQLSNTDNDILDHSETPAWQLQFQRKWMQLEKSFLAVKPEFITLQRVKILLIVLTLALAAFFFTTDTPSDGQFKNTLESVSIRYPHYIELKDHPSYIRLHVDLQPSTDNQKGTKVKFIVALEQLVGENHWKHIDNVMTLKLQQTETKIYKIPHTLADGEVVRTDLRLLFNTTSQTPVGFSYEVTALPEIVQFRIAFAMIVLVVVYGLIAFELVHRTIAAMFGAFVALAILSKTLERPLLSEVASWIDYNTCALLFGMMIMVGIISKTGCFEWAAVKMYKFSKGNIWILLVSLCILVGVLSALLDNVTTVLLLVPVSIRLCTVLKISPYPILLSEIMFTNLGGTATAIGDPPNIIIVSDPKIEDTKLVTFLSFMIHIAPATIIACICVLVYIRWVYKEELLGTRATAEMEMMPVAVSEEEADRSSARRLDDNEAHSIQEHNATESISPARDINEEDGEGRTLIETLEENYVITDWNLFISSCIVLGFVIILFFIHTAVELHLSMAWIAIIGAMIHMLVAGVKDIEEVLEKVEWGTLLFFGALFVLMHTLDELGLMDFFADGTAKIISLVPEGKLREAVAIILILWVSAFVSAFIDNIPFTTAMIPIISQLYEDDLKLPLTPMVWALVFGVCYGGNATIIGASANVVAVGIAESEGYHVTFKQFAKLGFPVMMISCTIATIFMLIFNVGLDWHEGTGILTS
eukprot:TRINITY_DN3917_c0_g1_i1.p1 TRINITY_DN3917_c0_g1~~TRINITY_DN3917_c0_g1_i1.p1  ORF type:complete len:721 (+),score=114.64 TRINITY_DN3917_c0_g1_i1:72-2234(+)